MTYRKATDLEGTPLEWLATLESYEKDLKILKKLLAEVITKNTQADSKANAEHFQNQFIVQQNNIDELKHSIGQHAHLMFNDVKQHAGHVANTLANKHKEIDAEVKGLEKTLVELRQDFNKYAAKWM
jgi:hypothetical protein